VVQTLRLQERHVVDYLHHAMAAHRSGQPAPKLLMTTGN
jgi:phage I-like protein